MNKINQKIIDSSRFSSFFGYVPGVMDRVRKLRREGVRFEIRETGPGGANQLYTGKRQSSKTTLESLSDLLSIQITQEEIAQHVPAALIVRSCRAKIVYGNEITRRYEARHGGKSCMTGVDSRFTEIYAANPQSCGMLVGEASFSCDPFRAIVWIDKRGLKVDRYYGNQIMTYTRSFRDFIPGICAREAARELGLKLRVRSSCGCHFVDTSGRLIHARFVLNWSDGDPLPYMDTVDKLIDYTSDTVTIGTKCSGSPIRELQNQHGLSADGTRAASSCPCAQCGSDCESDQHTADWISGIVCQSCYHDATTTCEICQDDCDSDIIDDVRIRRPHRMSRTVNACESCRDDMHELHDGDFAMTDDCTELHDGSYAMHDDCTELHDGEYALDDDCQELHDGSYALTDDCTELHNGEYALTDDCTELPDGSYAMTDAIPA